MQAWTDWFGTLGDKLVDGGNPVSNAKTTRRADRSATYIDPPSGYSIIKADSLDEAVELAKGCPVLPGRRERRGRGDVPGHVVPRSR